MSHNQRVSSHQSVPWGHVLLYYYYVSFLVISVQKQHIEIRQMKQHFEDELTKLRSGVLLDLNLEKSRAKEAVRILITVLILSLQVLFVLKILRFYII